jgi:hypothetical protein
VNPLVVLRSARSLKACFDYADVVNQQLRALHLPEGLREYRFDASGRRWRFDLAWVHRMLACEINGAEWQQGRHNRGAGMAKDFEKMNAAQVQGWVVLQFTGSQVKSGAAITVLEQVFR